MENFPSGETFYRYATGKNLREFALGTRFLNENDTIWQHPHEKHTEKDKKSESRPKKGGCEPIKIGSLEFTFGRCNERV